MCKENNVRNQFAWILLNSWIGNPESLDREEQWEKHVEKDTFQQFLSCVRAYVRKYNKFFGLWSAWQQCLFTFVWQIEQHKGSLGWPTISSRPLTLESSIHIEVITNTYKYSPCHKRLPFSIN